ncbi:hypothetical protein QJS10_CPB20g00586 [Acorus calamus]|uniref:Uncharacterized protein n=1 Tax=Acorus calamus TaxID=4465 RepID=A0AAV9CCR0_ACOCL|nr:hypothetical protein QJS10_CPB20g00586 [Acorus calamus]
MGVMGQRLPCSGVGFTISSPANQVSSAPSPSPVVGHDHFRSSLPRFQSPSLPPPKSNLGSINAPISPAGTSSPLEK